MKIVRLIGVFLLAALIAGCSLEAPEPAAKAEAPHPLDEDELLVFDPPEDYLRHLPDLGLEILDVTDLRGMGKTL